MSAHISIKPTRRSVLNSIFRELSQIFIALWLMLILPQEILETWVVKQINKYYPMRYAKVLFYKSARSGLTSFFRTALSENKEKVVLLPDYICNVVYLAAEQAGARIIQYSTDELFCPNMTEIEELLKYSPVCVVLLASIFGAQNNRADLLQRVRAVSPDTLVVFDESQNFVTNSPVHLDNRTAVLISFNNKTVPGVMGGALCLPPDSVINPVIPAQTRFSIIIHELQIIGMIAKRVLRKLLQFAGLIRIKTNIYPEYEFSQAVIEPYNIEPGRISKISLIYAYLGLRRLNDIEAHRKNNSIQIRKFFNGSDKYSFLETEFASIGPYMPVKIVNLEQFENIKLKGPYAIHKNKNVSLRPEVFSIINDSDVQLKCYKI